MITILGVLAKKIQGGGGRPKIPPPPPPPQHAEKMASTWREKSAHIEKYPHRETPTHMELFYSFSHAHPPRASAYFSPLACADHDLHSFYFVCLRELEKKSAKIKQKKFFWLSLNFFFGGGVSRLYQIFVISFIDSI